MKADVVIVQAFATDKVKFSHTASANSPHLVRESAAERRARELRRHGGRVFLPRQRVAEREGALLLRTPPPFQRAKMLLEQNRRLHADVIPHKVTHSTVCFSFAFFHSNPAFYVRLRL